MPLQVGMEEGPRSKVVLAGCSIASTARRKLISLLYCRNSYTLSAPSPQVNTQFHALALLSLNKTKRKTVQSQSQT